MQITIDNPPDCEDCGFELLSDDAIALFEQSYREWVERREYEEEE